MFSIQHDIVLDPFWGTGTTTLAAIASSRNSIGVEIDQKLVENFKKNLKNVSNITYEKNQQRLNNHIIFLKQKDKPLKHKSLNYDKTYLKKKKIFLLQLIKNIYFKGRKN